MTGCPEAAQNREEAGERVKGEAVRSLNLRSRGASHCHSTGHTAVRSWKTGRGQRVYGLL